MSSQVYFLMGFATALLISYVSSKLIWSIGWSFVEKEKFLKIFIETAQKRLDQVIEEKNANKS